MIQALTHLFHFGVEFFLCHRSCSQSLEPVRAGTQAQFAVNCGVVVRSVSIRGGTTRLVLYPEFGSQESHSGVQRLF